MNEKIVVSLALKYPHLFSRIGAIRKEFPELSDDEFIASILVYGLDAMSSLIKGGDE